eukprot:XP_001695798.1 predicted protein [Chlamydomonas reinhardtii]
MAVTAVTLLVMKAAGKVDEEAGAHPAQRCEWRQHKRRQVLPPALPLPLLCSRAARETEEAHTAR